MRLYRGLRRYIGELHESLFCLTPPGNALWYAASTSEYPSSTDSAGSGDGQPLTADRQIARSFHALRRSANRALGSPVGDAISPALPRLSPGFPRAFAQPAAAAAAARRSYRLVEAIASGCIPVLFDGGHQVTELTYSARVSTLYYPRVPLRISEH